MENVNFFHFSVSQTSDSVVSSSIDIKGGLLRIINSVIVTSIALCPIMWYLWADSMAGNANFYFATSLAVITGRKSFNFKPLKGDKSIFGFK